jgi:hypothetical protein
MCTYNNRNGDVFFMTFYNKFYIYYKKTTLDVHCINKDGKENDIIYYNDTNFEGINHFDSSKRKKLNGLYNQLFDILEEQEKMNKDEDEGE